MSLHIAPTLREMENAKASAGLIQTVNSVGYTERQAQEGVTQPTPHVAWVNGYYFVGTKYTPTL